MNYEKRDTVVTKIWHAVRNLHHQITLDDPVWRDLIRSNVEKALKSVEPDSDVSILSYIDGVVRMKWTGSDEVIRIRRTEGVMEVRVGAA